MRETLVLRTIDEMDLNPVLDVVFILLIFFIVSSTFLRAFGIDADASNAPSPTVAGVEAIRFNISQDNRSCISGRPVDLRAVRARVECLHAESAQAPWSLGCIRMRNGYAHKNQGGCLASWSAGCLDCRMSAGCMAVND